MIRTAEEHMRDGEPDDKGSDHLRVDRWLWCARLYKTRSLAAAAVTGGRVHVNGARVKPARVLRIGDCVAVSRNGLDVELHVMSIPSRRGPPPEAQACYQETPESRERAAHLQQQQRLATLSTPRPEGRPDKKSRRELVELARRQGRE